MLSRARGRVWNRNFQVYGWLLLGAVSVGGLFFLKPRSASRFVPGDLVVRQAFADDRGQFETLLREARKNEPERALLSLMNEAGVSQIARSRDDGVLRFVMFRAGARDLSFEES